MSDTIWLEVTDGGEKTGGERDNSIMLKLGDELDAMAERLGVPQLSTFYDNSALAEAYAEEIEGGDMAPVEPVWFEPSAGRQALEAILGALRENPAAVLTTSDPFRSHWPAMLLDELQYCHAALVEAEQSGQRFHLLVVP